VTSTSVSSDRLCDEVALDAADGKAVRTLGEREALVCIDSGGEGAIEGIGLSLEIASA
jgi:hypothetical protein